MSKRWNRIPASIGVLAILSIAAACASGDNSPEIFNVSGQIVRADDTATGLCHLAVSTISGGPVGETAEVVEEDTQFRWPLPPGTYDLLANCANGTGELRVTVPEDTNTDLVIVVS